MSTDTKSELQTQLEKEVKRFINEKWDVREGEKVPDPGDLKLLSNDAVELDATVLYADMAESTELVDNYPPEFAARIYESFLICCSRIIRDNGGVITAFDGDRVMAVYIDDNYKNTAAARTALQINGAVKNIINPLLYEKYGDTPKGNYKVKHAAGIDCTKVFVARTGVRNGNDLVWVGPAANYAAKLCSLRKQGPTTWMTKRAYDPMAKEGKISNDGRPMWEYWTWTAMRGLPLYASNWTWDL